MGGLDTQVEHHLFPGMPRPNLQRAQAIVRNYCRQHGILYTETSIWPAYATILRYLNQGDSNSGMLSRAHWSSGSDLALSAGSAPS
jgi:fatty acid desaturase